jgi:heme exporter protein D
MESSALKASRRNYLEWVWIALVCSLLAIYSITTLMSQRQDILAHEQARLVKQARIIGDFISNELRAADQVIRHMAAAHPPWLVSPRNVTEVTEHMTAMANALPAVRHAHMANSSGRVVASTVPSLPGRDFSDRPYFQTAARDHDSQRLYLTPPFKSSLNT